MNAIAFASGTFARANRVAAVTRKEWKHAPGLLRLSPRRRMNFHHMDDTRPAPPGIGKVSRAPAAWSEANNGTNSGCRGAA